MSRKFFKAVLGIGVLAALATVSSAQATKPMGLSVRAGFFMPSSGIAKDQGKNWFGFGAQYKLKDLGFGTMDRGYAASLEVSADYMSKGDLQSMPVLLNYVARQNQMFFSGGAGFSFSKEIDVVGPPVTTRNRTVFAYQIGVGYDFQQGQTPLFVEAKYFGSTSTDLNGFGVYVGVRF